MQRPNHYSSRTRLTCSGSSFFRLAPERICVNSAEIGLALTGSATGGAAGAIGGGGGAPATEVVEVSAEPSALSVEKSTRCESDPRTDAVFMLSPSCAIIC